MKTYETRGYSYPCSTGEYPSAVEARDFSIVALAVVRASRGDITELVYDEVRCEYTIPAAPGWKIHESNGGDCWGAHYQDSYSKTDERFFVPTIYWWGRDPARHPVQGGGFIRYTADECTYCGCPKSEKPEGWGYECPCCGGS